ncbi:SDR family NAD(P)-dependent oxidoreductase [Actinocrispum wychmicini]|uniref:Polyketide synthase-like dehydratase family protein n=1 Tax=Actinocrispum wychmicini TaxID=1213861 RepID=A0A4R2JKU0_9PSEU|nr:SDR family NAD(P)-dependent oxidoreductase [Actinocrispum wychmicini]TCO60621.1 polyketide synthase-like dehydratase family protein [Actinocrispum wychmicini]
MIGRHCVGLSRLPAVDRIDRVHRASPVALLAGDPGPLAQAVTAALEAAGWAVRRDLDGVRELDLALWIAPSAPDSVAAASMSLADALLTARDTQALLEQAGRAAFVTVTRLDISEVDILERAVLGGVSGLVKTLAIEAPSIYCRSLDLAPQLAERQCAELVLAELADSQADLAHVGYDADGTRWTATLNEGPLWTTGPEVAEPGPDDLLVVTGGGRGVTAACAIGLAERYKCGLLLIGRSRLREQPAWAWDVPDDGLKAAIVTHLRASGNPTPRDVERTYRDLVASREISQTLSRIREIGGRAEYLSVDIADAPAVAEALAGYRITGLVHGAGVLADQVIAGKRAEDVLRVLTPKLAGLAAVLAALDGRTLRHVVLFSSVAGFFGNRGQADYAMANEALNRMAGVLKRQYPDSSVTAINWGAWAGGMVTPELARMFTERGVTLIPLAEGVRHFVDQFRPERSRDVVTVVGPPLSTRTVRSSGSLVLHRDISRIAGHPVIADHAIGGLPVLPATVAIGAVLNAVSRIRPDLRTLTDFAVLKGLTGSPGDLRMRIVERSTPGSVGVLVLDESDRPRYQAVMSDTALPPTPVLANLPEPTQEVTAYEDGTLFHGPKLRGIQRMTDDRTVFACSLADADLADGAYAVDTYNPVLADLLLQAALVWVRHHRGVASLPVAVGGVECHAVLPDNEEFFVVVEQTGSVESREMCTVTACSRGGRVLLRFRDVDLVCSEALADKFAVGA